MLLDSYETKEKVLIEFLKICPFEGWSDETLLQAVYNCGISKDFSDLIFENGCLDLAEFYISWQNQRAAKNIADIENFSSQKIRDKIRLALYERLKVESDNQIVLQRLISFYLDPKNFTSFNRGFRPLFQGLKDCYKIADFIWREIKDQTTDFNFYSKRLTLAKIILRSVFVFVKDETAEFNKTKTFIDRQIANVMKFEKYKTEIKKIIGKVFLNENNAIKSPKELIANLPFFRLIKFK
ncbi:MAG: COQ9 family protein [Rickettsiales bacterium]|nr:COQ9 family protein [Rickettsiales bacterium]